MKKKQLNELRTKSMSELNALLKKKEADLIKFKLDLATKKVKNTRGGYVIRKDIAQIKTLISAKEQENV